MGILSTNGAGKANGPFAKVFKGVTKEGAKERLYLPSKDTAGCKKALAAFESKQGTRKLGFDINDYNGQDPLLRIGDWLVLTSNKIVGEALLQSSTGGGNKPQEEMVANAKQYTGGGSEEKPKDRPGMGEEDY